MIHFQTLHRVHETLLDTSPGLQYLGCGARWSPPLGDLNVYAKCHHDAGAWRDLDREGVHLEIVEVRG